MAGTEGGCAEPGSGGKGDAAVNNRDLNDPAAFLAFSVCMAGWPAENADGSETPGPPGDAP